MNNQVKLIKLNSHSPRQKKKYVYPRSYAIKNNSGFSDNVNNIIERYKKTFRKKKIKKPKISNFYDKTKKNQDSLKNHRRPKIKFKNSNVSSKKNHRRPKIKFKNSNVSSKKNHRRPKIKFENSNVSSKKNQDSLKNHRRLKIKFKNSNMPSKKLKIDILQCCIK